MKRLFFIFSIGILIMASCSSNNTMMNEPYSYNSGTNVTDADGNIYPSIVTSCGQTWTAKNLNVSKYSDGSPIPQVTDSTQFANLTTGAWCYYENNTANGPIYGKLYNWYAVAGIYDAASMNNPSLRKKLAPTGWHIPSNTEWNKLVKCIDPSADTLCVNCYTSTIAGAKMKEAGTTHWIVTNSSVTNSSGFSGLPGSYSFASGAFGLVREVGYWWSASEHGNMDAWYWGLDCVDNGIGKSYINLDKTCGLSIRFVKD